MREGAIAPRSLFERAEELAAIDGLLARTAGGSGGFALVEGGPGIGKTALLAAAGDAAAAHELAVLRARGAEIETELPFGVVRQLFEPLLATAPAAEREALLAGPARHAAAALGLSDEPVGGDAFTALHGLFWLIASLCAERPLVLLVDDLHWADVPSLRFLAYLTRRIRDVPTAIVAATRPPPKDASEVLVGLLADPDSIRVAPRLLSSAAVLALVRESYDAGADEAFASACVQATGGNPFLLVELLRTCRRDRVPADESGAQAVRQLAPPTVARVVLLRVGALGPDAHALASAVAVLGRPSVRVAAALAGLTPERAAQAADDLAADGVLEPGRPLDFLHPVLRAAVLDDLGPARAAGAHRRAADLLAREGAPIEEVAAHLAASEPAGDATVVEGLTAAARVALGRGAADSALSLMRRALAEPPAPASRAGVVTLLVTAATIAGAHAEAVEQALPLIDELVDPSKKAELAMLIVPAMAYGGRAAEADELCDRLADELGDRARELALKLEAHERFSRTEHAQAERLRRFRDLPGETPGERLVLSRTAHNLALLGEADVEQTLDIAQRALPGPELINIGSPLEGTCTFETLWALLLCDRPERIHPLGEAMANEVRRHGYEYPFAFVLSWAAELHWREGRVADAVDAAERGLAIAARYPFGVVPGHRALGFLVLALLEANRTDEALRAWDETDVGPNFMGMYGELRHVEGEVALTLGDVERGTALLLEFGEACERHGRLNPSYWPWRARVAPPLGLSGESERAHAIVDEGLERARAFGAPAPAGILLRAKGALATGEARLATLTAAADRLAGSPARLEHARALADLGGALRRANRRIDARERLTHALDLAHRCGAERLAEAVREELRAAGGRPRRAVLSGVASLTPSELRIAKLAAAGSTNREIAQELFLSVRTVEMHLSNAYRKLEIKTRAALPAALGS